MKKIEKLFQFIKDTQTELKKVNWTSREELMGSTSIVIVTCVLTAIFIGIIDVMLSTAVTFIFK